MAGHSQSAILVRRHACSALAIALSSLNLAAAPLGRLDDAVGAWEIVLDGSHRKCRVTLGADDIGGPGRPLRFPAGCRRALPILNTTATWAFDNGLIRFVGKDGAAVLAFGPREGDDARLMARTSN